MHRPAKFALSLSLLILTAAAPVFAGPLSKGAGDDLLSSMSAPPATASKKEKNMVTASVAADRQAIAPGDTFHLLVTLKMADGVHVYWRNPGATGLPTKIEWTGPAGFKFGRTQFPAPEAHYDEALKETSYIHSGTARFLTPVKVPANIKPGETATFRVKASWLSCRKGACVPGGKTLTIKVPIAAKSKDASEATLEDVESARLMAPTASDKADKLKLTTRVDKKTVKPGEPFHAILTAQIAPNHHMQSHKPLEDYLIAAVVFVEPVRGADVGEVRYPESHIRKDPMMGKMSEYSGKIDFNIPITLDKDADNKPRWIRGVLQSQICSDKGTCFPPQYLEFAIPLQIEGGPAPAASPNEFVERVAAATSIGDNSSTEHSPGIKVENATTALEVDDSRSWIGRLQDWFIGFGYIGVLILALIGGILLNLMPCVLPVISLKILSYVRQADENRGRIFALGLTYCLGILVFFGVLSWLYYSSDQGWSQQFQNPIVVLILAAIVMAFSLSLFGVFAVFTPKFVNQLGAKAEEREGLPSAFFTGLLATILGTACTGPFMSAALGAANKFTAPQGAGIFMMVGVGMMLPFLILSINPGWLKYVPKPGKWMGVFEAVMGFALVGTVIWIIYPLPTLIGDWGMVLALIFLLGVCVAVWVRGKAQFTTTAKYRLPLNLAALTILAVAWFVPFGYYPISRLQADAVEHERLYNKGLLADRTEPQDGSGTQVLPVPHYYADKIDWLPYDKELVRHYVEAGHTVFVDFTAEWCFTCKTNLHTSIDIEATRKLMRELRVIPIEANYTNKDPKMKKIINAYGRASVPMYLVFTPFQPDSPQILDEVLTPGTVAEALKQAGPSKPNTKVASAKPNGAESPAPNADAQ